MAIMLRRDILGYLESRQEASCLLLHVNRA